MTQVPDPPDFLKYHRSLTDELHSLKDRIRDLVKHWPTDGEQKEVALRTMLRRHLPESVIVGRGFVVSEQSASTQIDVLVVDGNAPTLFRDGDLMIITPDGVRAIIEVKTALSTRPMLDDAARKLADNARLCREGLEQNRVWAGLFVYDSDDDRQEEILRAVGQAWNQTDHGVNCVSLGRRTFVRLWSPGEQTVGSIGGPEADSTRPYWHSYAFGEDVAPSYFLGNLLQHLSPRGRGRNNYAWFPIPAGKEQYGRYRLTTGYAEPEKIAP